MTLRRPVKGIRPVLGLVIAVLLTVATSSKVVAAPACQLFRTGTTTVIVEDAYDITVTVTTYWVELCHNIPPRDFFEREFFMGRNLNGVLFDADGDGTTDKWRDVIKTNDSCAGNFDNNDRLGTNNGGPNTHRPGHAGVDIQANVGDWVRNWRTGTVSHVFNNSLCGKGVRVDHGDGTETWYCHLNWQAVQVDQTLYAGQFLGHAGNTGNSTGPHLHVVHKKLNGNQYWEYFSQTDNPPTSSQLNPNGC